MDPKRKFLGTGAAAQRLAISRARLIALLDAGKLPDVGTQIPGRRLFGPEDVEELREKLKVLREQEERTDE